MSNIEDLVNLDTSVILSLFVILFGMVTIFELIGKLSVYLDKPVRWVRKKNEDHETIVKLAENLDAIKKQQDIDREQSIKHDNEIKVEVREVANLFMDKNIEDMRWRILDFASAISNGRKFNRESYDFIIHTYEQYEIVLKKLDRTNGVVDETMQYIKEEFRERLRNGDFN